MDNPQLVDYIRSQMAAGHTEATIREHLINHGWDASTVDATFEHYNRSHVQSQPKAVPTGRGVTQRPDRHKRVRRRKRIIKVVVFILVIIAALVAFHSLSHKKQQTPALGTTHPTHQQQQSIDVITIGGAVGQYVIANNKTLPVRTATASDGISVVLCGPTCDPATWQVSALRVYKPANVKIVPYAPGLTVPNADTLYLVAGAKCDGDALTTKKVTPLSMVSFYATSTDTGLQQQCVSM